MCCHSCWPSPSSGYLTARDALVNHESAKRGGMQILHIATAEELAPRAPHPGLCCSPQINCSALKPHVVLSGNANHYSTSVNALL